jgi:hypothetical protein
VSERLARFFVSRWGVVLAGAVIRVLAPLLQKLGNPPNLGICIAWLPAACFERDIAGALGLHRAAVVQPICPEIIGFVPRSTQSPARSSRPISSASSRLALDLRPSCASSWACSP